MLSRMFAFGLIAIANATDTDCADASVGQFTSHSDVGNVQRSGSAEYDATGDTYLLSGAGANMWFADDEFHFVWRKLRGDFVLHARGRFIGEGTDPHRKIGWMVRASLAPNSAYADVAVHGDGLTSLQFRRSPGANTEEVKSTATSPDVLQLERRGNVYTMKVARDGEPLAESKLEDLNLGDEVYVGLFICSHRADVIERATFDNVRITIPAAADFRPYRDYIGSRLEIVEIATGHRQVVLESADPLQAPNWAPDGNSIIYNANGRLYAFDLNKRNTTPIDTGTSTRNNNDHVLSPDGSWHGISHHSAEHDNRSIVAVVPAAGGSPRNVTSQGPSYLHGWSPDGKNLLYTAERDGEFDIYRIPIGGGAEERLTRSPGLDDGAEYHPDGRTIYYNSSTTGRMQIWRMSADGSQPTQLTDDDYNNWFPHVAPDGQQFVTLSFPNTIAADDHPFYQHVLLRLFPRDGGKPRVLAYVYGGQGTINVPSWSPDGKYLALISNSQLITDR
ncbi:MAG: TolB family protein [Planctomycetales bacterium]|nr:TolB family protein [Planctomycetales bacterium]